LYHKLHTWNDHGQMHSIKRVEYNCQEWMEITKESQVGLIRLVGSDLLSPKSAELAESIEVANDPPERGSNAAR